MQKYSQKPLKKNWAKFLTFWPLDRLDFILELKSVKWKIKNLNSLYGWNRF